MKKAKLILMLIILSFAITGLFNNSTELLNTNVASIEDIVDNGIVLAATPKTQTYRYGEAYGTLPKLTWQCHNFLGWFTEKTGGTQITETSTVNATSNISLYAHWETAHNYTKQRTDATYLQTPATCQNAATYYYSCASCAGYTTSSTFTSGEVGEHQFGGGSTCTICGATVTTYTITYYPNGGIGTVQTQTVTAGSEIQLLENIFTNNNKELVGWSTVADNSQEEYFVGQSITPTSDMTLYATWYCCCCDEVRNCSCVVTEICGHGNQKCSEHGILTDSSSTYQSIFCTQHRESDAHTIEECINSGHGMVYQNGICTCCMEYYNYICNRCFMCYACHDSFIEYDSNGGVGTMGTQTLVTTDSTEAGFAEITLLPNAFTNGDKVFLGWAITPDGWVMYGNEETIVPGGDLTLYAVWGDNEIPIMLRQQKWIKSTSYTIGEFTKITFVNSYTPTGSESEVWNSDVNDEGLIKCYRTGSELIVAGNGTGKIYANIDSGRMFGCDGTDSKIEIIEGLNILDTSNVTNMQYMFVGNRSLTELDVSNFDTSNVTNMESMFHNLPLVSNLDVSSFNTSNVTDMNSMFDNLGVSSLDLSGFDTKNVLRMDLMFSNCSNLTKLDLSSFNTEKVTHITNMFWDSIRSKLSEVKLGVNFSFTGNGSTSCTLPPTSSSYWYTADGTAYAPADVPSNTAATYYAVNPAATYTITYNANGGTGSVASQTVIPGSSLTLSENGFAKDGYTFLGWSESSSATTATYTAGQTITPTRDITLYAVWEAEAVTTYTITYNPNGGSGNVVSQYITKGNIVVFLPNTFTREGYRFLGWSTDSSATSATHSVGEYTTPTDNMTLYAVWEELPLLKDVVTVGDYVDYYGPAVNYTVPSSLTGTDSDQTIIWNNTLPDTMYSEIPGVVTGENSPFDFQIFNNAEDGIEIIKTSKEQQEVLKLSGETGFRNVVQILQDITTNYKNEFALSARSLGYSEEGLTTAQIKQYKNISSSLTTDFPGRDSQATSDFNIINANKDIFLRNINVYYTVENLWAASRYYDLDNTNNQFYIRSIGLAGSYNIGVNSQHAYVCPIVKLDPSLRAVKDRTFIRVDGGWQFFDLWRLYKEGGKILNLTYSINGGTYGSATTPNNKEPITETVILSPSEATNGFTFTIDSTIDGNYSGSTGLYQATKSGYKFGGWSENADATSATYVAGDTITINKDTLLYAVWIPVCNCCGQEFDACTCELGREPICEICRRCEYHCTCEEFWPLEDDIIE